MDFGEIIDNMTLNGDKFIGKKINGFLLNLGGVSGLDCLSSNSYDVNMPGSN